MDNEPFGIDSDATVPQIHPTSAEVPSEKRTSTWKRVLQIGVGVGVAAGVAVGATALASAATSNPGSSTSTTTPSNNSKAGPGSGHHFGGRGFGGPGGFAGAGGGFGVFGGQVLHGEGVIKGPNGYETVEVQNGTVTSVTDVSGSTWKLVVTSADKTAITYVVNSGTSVDGGESGISTVKKGDTVYVIATVSSGTSTAKSVSDSTVMKANGSSWQPRMPQGTPPGGQSGPPSTAPSSSSST